MKRLLPLFVSILVILLLVFCLSFRAFEFAKPFLPYAPYLLGQTKPTSYLVLLGNDAEMRANGGFAGSYAKIILSTTKNYHLTPEISFQDIYVPNGQIKGLFVKPPEPVQQAFGHGSWELANADWEPDFPSSAKTLRWFFEKGKEINPDNLVLLNLSTIKKVLNLVGSFPVPEYQATLTPDNLYQFLQGKAELNFFPGSTQKKDTLTAVGQALIKKIKSLSLLQKYRIAQVLFTDFQNQNLLVNSTNPAFQTFLVERGLAGVLQPEALDTFSLVETNLGANKANAYITRSTDHQVSFQDHSVHHQVEIKFQNSSPEANPNPPLHYGGNYLAYLRFYLPATAENLSFTHTPLDLSLLPLVPSDNATDSARYGLKEIGFWQTTLAGNQSTVSLGYDLPLSDQKAYTLAILKQHGLVTSPQTLNLFGHALATDLTQDFRFP